MRATKTRAAITESLKLFFLVLIFYIIQAELHGVRRAIYGNKRGVAEAQSTSLREWTDAQEKLEAVLSDCQCEILETRAELDQWLGRIEEEREGSSQLLAHMTQELKRSIASKLESERGELEKNCSELKAHAENLGKLSALLSKDSTRMKEKMIYPTAQLKGNGTVGSGVIIYSELQPAPADSLTPIYATFIITAYHVVLEVMGEELERGIVDEVQVFQADGAAMAPFSAKLVLFDNLRDLALLRVNSTRRFQQVAELMPIEDLPAIDVFASAYAVGCPLGNRPLPTLGEISSKQKIVADQVFWMLSAPTFFGNSGGGVYLAATCQLIGVSSMIYTYGKTNPTVVPHMGLFVPLVAIYRWLDSEGYSFVHERRSVPREMFWKLVYVEKNVPWPEKASGRDGR